MVNENMLIDVRKALRAFADESDAIFLRRFFKTGPGEYGEGDRFIGFRVPATHRVAREFRNLPMADTLTLLRSDIHEERLLALIILSHKFKAGTPDEQTAIYRAYLDNTPFINNWDLVSDTNDLIHKAVGWMLREVGKRDRSKEEGFLVRHYRSMPRTMLRYAIEKFPEQTRQQYLKGTLDQEPDEETSYYASKQRGISFGSRQWFCGRDASLLAFP